MSNKPTIEQAFKTVEDYPTKYEVIVDEMPFIEAVGVLKDHIESMKCCGNCIHSIEYPYEGAYCKEVRGQFKLLGTGCKDKHWEGCK